MRVLPSSAIACFDYGHLRLSGSPSDAFAIGFRAAIHGGRAAAIYGAYDASALAAVYARMDQAVAALPKVSSHLTQAEYSGCLIRGYACGAAVLLAAPGSTRGTDAVLTAGVCTLHRELTELAYNLGGVFSAPQRSSIVFRSLEGRLEVVRTRAIPRWRGWLPWMPQRIRAHCDEGLLTFLLPATLPGAQVRDGNAWVDAYLPGAVVVFAGRALSERAAARHRVVGRPGASHRDAAMFRVSSR